MGAADFFYLIPFDCDWAFHQEAFFDPQGKDSTGLNEKWDKFCCLPNKKRSKENQLVKAIITNNDLQQNLLEKIMDILEQYMLPLNSGLLYKRDQQMWNILKPYQTFDPYGKKGNDLIEQCTGSGMF